MALQNLRTPAEPRSRRFHFEETMIDPALVESVERVFDRGGIVGDLESLFDDHKIGGQEIQTVPDAIAPIGSVRYVFQPALREALERMIDSGDDRPDIRPQPEVRMIATVGWPGVFVAPTGRRSAQVKRISGPQGGSPEKTAAESLREALQSHTYFLTVDGTQYPIDDIEGTVLQLQTDLEFSSTSRGTIHNGASKLFLVGEPDGPGNRVKDKVENEAIDRPTPILSGETIPGMHSVSIRTTDKDQSFRQEEEVEVKVSRPPEGRVEGTGYRTGAPEGEPTSERALNRTMSVLVANVTLEHPTSDAVLLGFRYRVATKSEGEWRYGPKTFVPFQAETIQWMLSGPDEVESKERSGIVELGTHSSAHERRVEMKFIDEMGRVSGVQTVDRPPVSPGAFNTSSGIKERFATLAEQSKTPSDKSVVQFYDKADSEIEPLRGEAESVVKGRSLEEVPIEEFQPPIARLSVEVVDGKRVQLSASESGHPNGLDNRFRFDWNADGSWNTTLGFQETVEHTFDEGGAHSPRLQAVDEIDATHTDSATVILPKADLTVDFSLKQATVDASDSVKDPAYPLEYRISFRTWKDDVEYVNGDVVYYKQEETAYQVVDDTLISKGTTPTDSSGSLNGGWEVAAWQTSPTSSYDYDGDPAGAVYQIAVEVRDARGARDDTLMSVFIPDFQQANLSARAEGDTAIVSISPSPTPDEVDTFYAFDWDTDGTYDTGALDTNEQPHTYSDPANDKSINVKEETGAGATSEASVTTSFVDAAFASISYDPDTNPDVVSVDASNSTTTSADTFGDGDSLEYRFRIDEAQWTSWGAATTDVPIPPSDSQGDKKLTEGEVEVQARDAGESTDTATQTVNFVEGGGSTSNPGEAIEILTPGQKIRVIGPAASDPEGYDFEFRIDWGSGFDEWNTDNIREQAAEAGGAYSIVFQARTTNPNIDNSEKNVYEESANISFPQASFTLTKTGVAVEVDASGSTHPDGDTLQYRWDWEGDGTWDTAFSHVFSTVHTYTSSGSRTIKLEVQDEDGASHVTTQNVSIIADDFDRDLPEFQ